MCEHVFVTSQGHPYARYRHTPATGPRIAEAAARDLHNISLRDALTLCFLYRTTRSGTNAQRRATDRRAPKIHLSEIELAAAGFREALHSERAVDALRGCL